LDGVLDATGLLQFLDDLRGCRGCGGAFEVLIVWRVHIVGLIMTIVIGLHKTEGVSVSLRV